MDTILEHQRRLHEEVDRLEQAVVDQFMLNPKTHRERLFRDLTVDSYLDRIQTGNKNLQSIYKDEDGSRKKEIDTISGANEFEEFYNRLRIIKDHHRRYPNESVEPMELEFVLESPTPEQLESLDSQFTGEESVGRYLDLHELHQMYMNLKNFKRASYLQYLSEFTLFEQMPKEDKNADYQKYLDAMNLYLGQFLRRAKPLTNIPQIKANAWVEFEKQWQEGTVPGWPKPAVLAEPPSMELFCVACKKLFAKESVYTAHLTGKKHLREVAKLEAEGGSTTAITATAGTAASTELAEAQAKAIEDKIKPEKDMAWGETLAKTFAEILTQKIDETKENVERRQTLTGHERDLELVEDQPELPESDDEEEEKVYNPLKLPLGWDGKPIPFWLYKLHGLGVEYTCEICGGYVYKGRKAFDKHFQERRHANGMRSLGIPNTRQFHEITGIEDALALWKRIEGTRPETVKRDQIEEYEDDEGNVFNKKTYEDLKRQGLI
ncbi:hypothetical protein DFQ27_006945 [Actinomortierella ambigua]|uniref:Matrin-type domain-containing protein n=1 Tax=Actinomortierella ambigua TaxID=1343610 RepID=A0A9P6PWB8_9FUNG|nr:hypothetical protein DFQ27_006945 [Actinomortierella ambigua]